MRGPLAQSVTAINAIQALKDSEDVKSQILVNFFEGIPLHKSIHHARASCARDRQWDGITRPRKTKSELKNELKTGVKLKVMAPSFDYLDHSLKEDGMDLHERIVDPMSGMYPADLLAFKQIAQSRGHTFEDHVEKGLAAVGDSAAAWGRLVVGWPGRRGRQVSNKNIDRQRGESDFRKGGKGKGSLFWFGGSWYE